MKTHLVFFITCLAATFPAYATEAKTSTNQPETIDQILDKLTPDEKSVLEERLKKTKEADNNRFSIAFYRPTYVLPYYYTASPYEAIYNGNTPDNQSVMSSELKAQLSILVPVLSNLFNNPNSSLNVAYTQVSYWQVYTDSQYFRETNYEPEVFYENHFHRNWLMRLGFNHQSNGRGGALERSWNRAIASVQTSGNNWLFDLKVWKLIFAGQSSESHNPDISHYLGYENILFAYKFPQATISLEAQNLESGLQRGFIQLTASHPIWKHMSLYAQYFNGYGQSLIEYNHRTQSVGVGIALNDWI